MINFYRKDTKKYFYFLSINLKTYLCEKVSKMKKVLIVTYYWKPAGGPGVQRWLKFVKYLRDFGVEPIVFIPENPHYPIIDNEIGNDLPTDIQIVRMPIWEPYQLASLFSKNKTKKISSGIIPRKKVSVLENIMLWIRGNLFIPDARKFWVKPSIKFLSNFIQHNDIQTVITTSPPHSVHLIGFELKKKIKNLQWISDFRDPWTSIGYHKDLRLTKWADKLHKKLEKNVLQTADLVITTSFKTKEEFSKLTDKKIEVITNGYDTEYQEDTKLSEFFLVSHIGSLLSDRNPINLWSVFSELITENQDFAHDFRLCFAGKISNEIENEIKKYGLNNHFINKGYIAHNEAVKLQRETQVLLLIEINSEESKGIIAGKLFEYMASKRPIIAIGPKDWDVSKIIESTQTGKTVGYNEKALMKKIIMDYYNRFKANSLNTNPLHLEKYHRKNLTKRLSEVIK